MRLTPSIYYLLPHTVYEQAWVLYRTLWETSVSLEWIALDSESRAHRFLKFTAVEYRRFIDSRIRTARRVQNATEVLELTRQLAAFEIALEEQLPEFSFSDKRGRKRWQDRFSAPTLQDVVREVGGEWLEEHDRDYRNEISSRTEPAAEQGESPSTKGKYCLASKPC